VYRSLRAIQVALPTRKPEVSTNTALSGRTYTSTIVDVSAFLEGQLIAFFDAVVADLEALPPVL
jgi:hypothetical protein